MKWNSSKFYCEAEQLITLGDWDVLTHSEFLGVVGSVYGGPTTWSVFIWTFYVWPFDIVFQDVWFMTRGFYKLFFTIAYEYNTHTNTLLPACQKFAYFTN